MRRAVWAAALVAVGLLVLVGIPRVIEARIAVRLRAAARTSGIALRVQRIRFSWLGRVDLEDVTVEVPRRFSMRAERLRARWRPGLGERRSWLRSLEHRGLVARLVPLGVEARAADAVWSVTTPSRERAVVERPGLSATLQRGVLELSLRGFPLGRAVSVVRRGDPLVDCERVDGSFVGTSFGRERRASAQLFLKGLRVAAAPDEDERAELGAATDLELSFTASYDSRRSRLEVACARVEASGVEASGEGALETAPGDVWADVSVEVPRFELGSVLAVSGLELPVGPSEGDLGSLALTARAQGHLKDAEAIAVDHRLDFRPPPRGLPAFAYLRGPFTHTAVARDGRTTRVEVRPGSPTFVPLAGVPSLFLRALTIAEDAAFWGHPGIDLQEIPVAFATNWARGERARGASTITQQLVKNLFLSREKRYGRKLQEVALALLLESALSKERILEIYLNVIEWGPGLYGLRPAARRYFGKEPAELNARETALLVCLIPGPIKYQRSIAGGSVSPGFRRLMAGLLAKLRSVDAVTEEEYQEARADLSTYGPSRAPSVALPFTGEEVAPEATPGIPQLFAGEAEETPVPTETPLPEGVGGNPGGVAPSPPEPPS